MLTATKMLTEDWCVAVEAEEFAGPLSQLAAQGELPAGVNVSDPRAMEHLRRCYQASGVLPEASIPLSNSDRLPLARG